MKRILLNLAFSLYLLSAEAQDWTVYTATNSPLPNNHIQAIALQKNGIKWVGTPGGLSSFDGHDWKNYNPGNSGLPSSNITAMCTGNQDNIWIGTDKGLVHYDGTAWTVFTTQNSPLRRNTISKLFWDNKTESLWVATEIGLVKYDGTNWVDLEDSNSFFADEVILSIEKDRNGVVWVGSFDHFQFQGRLWQFDGTSWKRTKLEDHGLSSSFPTALLADKQNVLWLTIKGTMGGFLVSLANEKWTILDKQTLPCLEGGVTSIALEGSQIWMGTGTGVLTYKETPCRSYNTHNSGLPDDFVSCIAIDEKGNKWMGTVNGGLVLYGIPQQQNQYLSELRIFPNPIIETASISFQLPIATTVVIDLYSASGQLVQSLYNQTLPAGSHKFTWRFSRLPKGVYYCRMRYGENAQLIKKIVVG